jgi:urea transport system permease protein
MLFLRPLAGLLSALAAVLATVLIAGVALAADLPALVGSLTAGSFADRETAVGALAVSGDARAAPILEALAAGQLYVRKSDNLVLIGKTDGNQLALTEAISGKPAGSGSEADLDRVRVNNRLRGIIEAAVGSLTLMSPDARVRREAADALFKRRDASSLAALDQALAGEKDQRIKRIMSEARAASVLASDAPAAQKVEAIALVRERGDRDALAVLQATAASSEGEVKDAATAGAAAIRQTIAAWEVAQNVWYGISLGSVLLLAAIGLAITFGTMGVINMAHGEMVMLGAYTTFVVQEVIRTSAPHLFDASLVIALPLAFLVAGGVGILIERSIIRFLYGRPLETLLATWGISLMLQQAVRMIFGAPNKEVANPAWMTGGFDLIGGFFVTWNRLYIIVFCFIVLGILVLIVQRTHFGLQMRAVTQNRDMARAMGIPSARVDALTFGLGSGIAGMAGVALSQIGNVSPNLGTIYIVDSFLVVVFGGVGNLTGTLVGAMGLGIVNKFLEPVAGAVLGKVVILVAIILFIQRRPRGLFALKGRTVEA